MSKSFLRVHIKRHYVSKCFESKEEDVIVQFSRWQRSLNRALHSCFRKIRINHDKRPKQSRIDELMTKKKEILKNRKLTKNDVDSIDQIEKEITEEVADKEYEKLERVLGDLESNTNTNIWFP